MIVLGIFVMGGAATLGGLLIADNLSAAPAFTPQLLGHTLPSVSAVDVFVAGLTLAFLICLGLWMIAAGTIERHRRVDSAAPVDELLPGNWRTP